MDIDQRLIDYSPEYAHIPFEMKKCKVFGITMSMEEFWDFLMEGLSLNKHYKFWFK